MATFLKLLEKKNEIIDETYRRINEAERYRALEYRAVVRIQAWYRAIRTRAYLRHLQQSAVKIQKSWRGYTGRNRYREILKQQVFHMKLSFYSFKAIKIQKVWRGYCVRKYVFNFYSRKKYLEGLQMKNELVRNELAEYAEHQEMMRQIAKEEEDKRRLDDWATRKHHLISTQVQPGIYNSPFQPYPDVQEFHLRNAKPRSHPPPKKSTIVDPACTRYDLPVLNPLPPIGPKPMGPFRDSQEVQHQRYKAFKPSLRVQTDYFSLEKARQQVKDEEWVKRLHDDLFKPFHKKNDQYERDLHNLSQYGSEVPMLRPFDKIPPYEDFKSLVPPIPLFDKLNETYSQGEV